MSKRNNLRALCECAVLVALAMALSYLEIPIGIAVGGFGGSLSLVMVPLVLCAVRWGLGWGLGTGLVFGVLKYFFSNGVAINWEAIILDYAVAYLFVGFAGLFHGKGKLTWLAALTGCLARFLVHFVSGVTVYAAYAAPIMGYDGSNAAIYSAIYNGTYMLPNTVLTVAVCLLLQKPLQSLLERLDGKK